MQGFLHTQYYLSICKACENKERIAKKNCDPLEQKARDTINRHAQRENKSFRSFLYSNDLTIDFIKTLFKREWQLHELGYGCVNCQKPLKDMLDDFTLDLIDPKRPATRSNLRIICRTCNTEKGNKDPTQYDLEQREYRRNELAIQQGVQFPLKDKPKHTSIPQLQLL